MAFDNIYEVDETIQEQAIKYFFISSGSTEIVKAVEYRYVQDFGQYPLFNLGFGDYDLQTDTTSDLAISNNGDTYTVFHTVLSTVPRFFEANPHAVMMVQGSDSSTAFLEKCKQSCRKKCDEYCKNTNRRISTYRWYVNKNFSDLSKTYTFYGGVKSENGLIVPEPYNIGREYNSVFCKKK